MKCIAIIGAKKCGKTTLTKGIIRDVVKDAPRTPVMVYDKNREWGERSLPTMSDFLKRAQQAKGTLIVWEDAGIFFPNNGRSAPLLDVLTAARHTRNTSFLLFHSLRSVPLYVLDHLDGMWILPTRDLASKVEQRFEDWPDVVDGWSDVMDDVKGTGIARLTDAVAAAGYPRQYVEL